MSEPLMMLPRAEAIYTSEWPTLPGKQKKSASLLPFPPREEERLRDANWQRHSRLGGGHDHPVAGILAYDLSGVVFQARVDVGLGDYVGSREGGRIDRVGRQRGNRATVNGDAANQIADDDIE